MSTLWHNVNNMVSLVLYLCCWHLVKYDTSVDIQWWVNIKYVYMRVCVCVRVRVYCVCMCICAVYICVCLCVGLWLSTSMWWAGKYITCFNQCSWWQTHHVAEIRSGQGSPHVGISSQHVYSLYKSVQSVKPSSPLQFGKGFPHKGDLTHYQPYQCLSIVWYPVQFSRTLLLSLWQKILKVCVCVVCVCVCMLCVFVCAWPDLPNGVSQFQCLLLTTTGWIQL